MESLPAHEVVIVATGSQGEPTSAMVRMSLNDHRQLMLREGDTVVLSATPIPGNEELFNRTVDNLFRQGANVLYHELGNVHVSGHGGQDDYLRMFNLVRPQLLHPRAWRVPPPGTARPPGAALRPAQGPRLHPGGRPDGRVWRLRRHGRDHRRGRANWCEAGHVYVDGLGVGDIGNVVLRDRRQLSQEGFIVCIVAVDEFDGEVIYGPEIISRGFVYMREQEDLIRRAQDAVNKVIKKKDAGLACWRTRSRMRWATSPRARSGAGPWCCRL